MAEVKGNSRHWGEPHFLSVVPGMSWHSWRGIIYSGTFKQTQTFLCLDCDPIYAISLIF